MNWRGAFSMGSWDSFLILSSGTSVRALNVLDLSRGAIQLRHIRKSGSA